MWVMPAPHTSGPKEVAATYTISGGLVPVEKPLYAAAAGLASTQTRSGVVIGISADWEPWRIFGDPRPDRLTLELTSGGQQVIEGRSFGAETRYVQHDKRGGVMRGSVLFKGFCGYAADNKLHLSLVFKDTQSPVLMWYTLTSELVVYHTIKAIAEEIRATLFNGESGHGPALDLLDPGWTNVVLRPLGTRF
jgi:hypothetical protein